MNSIWEQLIANKQKAVVGFASGAVIAYFAKHGLDLNTLTVGDALRMLGSGVFAYVSVFVKRNKPS